jgi:aerotolerance regulator-like protein/VWA domain-containing protein
VSFLNPLFLFGLAAAAVPILIHLFTRKRPREMRFPSLEFLSEVNRSEIRRLRLRQWLLLLLRTLAVAALALAISRPALRGTAGLGRNASTTVVALVDRSASMGAMAPDGTLLAGARRAVEGLLATLGPADELLLVPYDQGPHPVSARPLGDVARLRAETQALATTARATDHAPALDFAARALAESHALNRELFWLTDFQATGFGPQGRAPNALGAQGTISLPAGPWEQVRVYLMPFAPVSRANVGLSDASLAPTGSGTALSVAGIAHGARPGDLSVEVRDLSGDAELGRGYLSLPPEGEASTLLPLARLPDLGGVAILPDDALALDNRRVFAAGRAGTVSVLVREDGPASPLRLALEAGGSASGLAVSVVDAAGLAARIGEADVVVLNDLSRLGPVEQQAVLDFHRGGGGLFVVLGGRADPAAWNASLLPELGVGALGGLESAAPGAAWRLRRAAAGHPVLAGFPARPGEALSTGSFRSIPVLDPRAPPGGSRSSGTRAPVRVLLEYGRTRPALIEAPHALILAAVLDPATSDFPVSGAFLPLLHQCVKVLARGTAAGSFEPGDRYSAPAGTGAWRIEDDQGRELPSEMVSEAGATRLTSAPLERPGLYRVSRGGTLHNTFAVNPSGLESDLSPLPEAALVQAFPPGRARVLRPGADLARRVREARFGRELWGWFMVAALVLLVTEMIVARWGMESRPKAADAA